MSLQFSIGSNHQIVCMQHLNKFHGRRISNLTMRDIAEIRARSTSPSTRLVTVDGLVQNFQASNSVFDGHAGVLTVGRVAWIRTNQTDHFLAWCAFQMWPVHPGKRTFEDHDAEIGAMPIVGKKMCSVLPEDISLAQEFALATNNNAVEIALEEGAIYVAYVCTVDDMLHAIQVSPSMRTVIFGARVDPSKAIASLFDLHRAMEALR